MERNYDALKIKNNDQLYLVAADVCALYPSVKRETVKMALELVLNEQSKLKSKSTYSKIRVPKKYGPNLLLTLRATFSNIRARYQRHPGPTFQRF